jgi:hypothetical protein
MRWILSVALVATLAACTDSAATTLRAANEWDRDVIIAFQTSSVANLTVLVPARSYGQVGSGWGAPGPDAQVTVFDTSCVALQTVPLTINLSTVRVSTTGSASVETWWEETEATRDMVPVELKRASCP